MHRGNHYTERPQPLAAEILDSRKISKFDLIQALLQLDKLNAFANVAEKLWNEIRPHLSRDEPITFLDIACGSGSNLKKTIALARRDGFSASGIGLDRNPESIAYAGQGGSSNVSFLVGEGLSPPELPPSTVVFSTLFLHHLSMEDAARLLCQMQRLSSRICLVHDLERSSVGALMLRLFFLVFRPSPIIRMDGIISMRQAFSLDEVRNICGMAGIREYHLTRSFPLKFMLRWGA